MLFRKDATIRERATVALANLQRNSYAMSMLRGKLEARINFILSDGGKGGEYQEMARVLELVKNSEMILNELSGKVESARFLEEFITIIDSAAASVSGIKGDVENLVPIAENALLEMHDAIAKISTGLYGEPVQQILDEAAAVPAVEALVIEQTTPVAAIPAQEATREEEEDERRQAELA